MSDPSIYSSLVGVNMPPNSLGAQPDLVNHPPHYKAKNGMEVIDVIEGFGLEDDHYLATVVAYILRHRLKGGEEDLAKAKWYLDRRVGRTNGHEGSHSL